MIQASIVDCLICIGSRKRKSSRNCSYGAKTESLQQNKSAESLVTLNKSVESLVTINKSVESLVTMNKSVESLVTLNKSVESLVTMNKSVESLVTLTNYCGRFKMANSK